MLDLLLKLQASRASRLLRSSGNGKNLFSDLSRLGVAVNSDDFDLGKIESLFQILLTDKPNDVQVWQLVYDVVTELALPPLSSELVFDPTIKWADQKRFIEITRNGSIERIIIDKVILRPRRKAGRATTCFKAHLEGQPEVPLVVKDSWQYPERDEEGELLCDATNRGVVNVARYYHHETVQSSGSDNVQNSLLRGLDAKRATDYAPSRTKRRMDIASKVSGDGYNTKKRSSSQTGAPLPANKRSCSASPADVVVPSRVHRRVIVRDYGLPIYKASSRSALLAALQSCLEGHESLYQAGLLHRDISINNLMINEDENNPSWPAFLIDLDLAVKESRESASGAKGKAGTQAFMAIGLLLGEQHSFMHDIESFFWVLFWICIRYDGPGRDRLIQKYNWWNHENEWLGYYKSGLVADEGNFCKIMEEDFTPYYQPLSRWINRLRKVIFPNNSSWTREDPTLYARFRHVLKEAGSDSQVLVET